MKPDALWIFVDLAWISTSSLHAAYPMMRTFMFSGGGRASQETARFKYVMSRGSSEPLYEAA